MIASLSMYRRPQLRDAHARYWTSISVGLAAAGIDSPEQLDETTNEVDVWNDPTLVLSQTCGMPYRLGLHNVVQLVGTPDFAVDGCPPGYYRSALVVRHDDTRSTAADFEHAMFAYNQADSQSGYSAPYFHTEPLGFWFSNRTCTGGHLESATAVAAGAADIAAIDAVSMRLITRYSSSAHRLRILEWTTPTPGLPYITSASARAAAIYEAVSAAISNLSAQDRAALGIVGLVRIPRAEYLSMPNPPPD